MNKCVIEETANSRRRRQLKEWNLLLTRVFFLCKRSLLCYGEKKMLIATEKEPKQGCEAIKLELMVLKAEN